MSEKGRVARYQADRTNQKLYFCRLACKAAGEAQDKQLYQGHCETAIFHLHGAFLAFLQELTQFYNLTMPAPTMASIEEALAKKTLVSPEVVRLKQMTEQGFMADVLRAFERCQYAPKPSQPEVTDSSADLIVNVVTLSNQWLPDESTIREWRQQLLALIESLRAGMVEY